MFCCFFWGGGVIIYNESRCSKVSLSVTQTKDQVELPSSTFRSLQTSPCFPLSLAALHLQTCDLEAGERIPQVSKHDVLWNGQIYNALGFQLSLSTSLAFFVMVWLQRLDGDGIGWVCSGSGT